MNDLMTKSFLNYVELKKEAMKELESERDLEKGHQPDSSIEKNLANFFEEVKAIKSDMEEITNLFLHLQDLNRGSKSINNGKVLNGIRDRINADIISVLQKAKSIKSRLELLDCSNVANRCLSMAYKEGSPVDRTRVSVTTGLRVKLRDMMHDFQTLREQILKDHMEGLKRRYYNVTGEEPSEEVIEKMILGGGQEKVLEGKVDLVKKNQERNDGLIQIQRSLTELHQVFLDMAAMVETQGDEINNIEDNVVSGTTYINGGTNNLHYAKLTKKRKNWACWVGIFLLALLVILVSTLAS